MDKGDMDVKGSGVTQSTQTNPPRPFLTSTVVHEEMLTPVNDFICLSFSQCFVTVTGNTKNLYQLS